MQPYPQAVRQGVYPSPDAVVIQPSYAAPPPSPINTRYAAKASIVCGGMQLAIGNLLIILNIVGIVVGVTGAITCYGIVSGIFFIITGAYGLVAGKKRTHCPITTSLVLSIISAVGWLNVLILGIFCALMDVYDECDYGYDYDQCSGWQGKVAISSLMAILGAAEGIVAIVSSGLGCAGTCACCYPPPTPVMVMATSQYATHPAPGDAYAIAPDAALVHDGQIQNPPEYVVTDDKQPIL